MTSPNKLETSFPTVIAAMMRLMPSRFSNRCELRMEAPHSATSPFLVVEKNPLSFFRLNIFFNMRFSILFPQASTVGAG